jgi:uncharacterized protein (TIGR02996 family)
MNAEQQALLRTIFDNPDDDAPRLVYADWLEERGDPDHTVRAHLIRQQIALRPADPDHSPASQQNDPQGLLAVAEERCTPQWLRSGRAVWDRGFIQEVRCNTAAWVDHANEILAEHPIDSLTLEGEIQIEHVPVLITTPNRVPHIDMSNCTWSPGIQAAALTAAVRVLAVPFMEGLHLVRRAWPRITSAQAEA